MPTYIPHVSEADSAANRKIQEETKETMTGFDLVSLDAGVLDGEVWCSTRMASPASGRDH
jgi:hypothetical protein